MTASLATYKSSGNRLSLLENTIILQKYQFLISALGGSQP